MLRRSSLRRHRGTLAHRSDSLTALAALAIVAFLYWKPMHTYLRTKHALQEQQAQVRSLQVDNTKLKTKIKLAYSDTALLNQARQLGLVRPGERMFQVTGIDAWRHRDR